MEGCAEQLETIELPSAELVESTEVAAPQTKTPARGAPEEPTSAYDPDLDPKNTGGFVFSHPSPSDPAARRRKPFSIEALYKLKRPSDPRFSPDGKTLVFVLTRYDLAAGSDNSDIYAMDADGKNLRRMTRDPASDTSPRWAPDSQSFIFISTRKDGAQLWRMPVAGGEAEQLTRIATGVSSPVLAPGGKRVAFVSRVFPEYGADDVKNKAALDAQEKNPIKAHIADDLLHRHWTHYRGGRRSHVLLFDLRTRELIDLTPGDFDSPAFSEQPGFAFSPDGKELCFVSNREKNPSARAWTTNKDLFVVGVPAPGSKRQVSVKPRNLTSANKAYDGDPSYSPDGRFIAFIRYKEPGYESDRSRLALYERKTGTIKVLTESFDYWVLRYVWHAKSHSLIFRAAQKGRFPLFELTLADPDVTPGTAAAGKPAPSKLQRLALPGVRHFDVAQDGRLAFTFSSVSSPLEVFTAAADGRDAQRLTHFNREVTERHDVRPVEEMWIPGAAGHKVHTFIVKPHGFRRGRRYPLIINVHGGPQYQWADTFRGDWQVYPGAGYVVAYFNPHGSTGYGQAYTAAISKDYGGKVYADVMKVTDALAKLPYVDGKRIGAMGWSYGGYMMGWLLGHTTRFRAIASMMGIYDLTSFYGSTEELWFPEWDLGGMPWTQKDAYAKWSPSSYAKHFRTPTLVITGEKDYRVPYTQSLQLFTALRRQNVPARLIVLSNDGHWPDVAKSMPLYYAAHLDWFHHYLGGAPSPYDIHEMVRGRDFLRDKTCGRRSGHAPGHGVR
ncbi:MAG: S9 family peptidase [Deltaproteobacteria bacterium]|nr:S9 family peptidase [Deltaproteobacteria bacterium]